MNESKSMQGICVTFCVLIFGSVASAQQHGVAYCIVDTGQERCYGNGREIRFPEQGQPFFAQDAQYEGNVPAYRDDGNGTITDLNTGLMWQKTPDFVKRTLDEAETYAKSLTLAGHSDWRLPTIKELFSIADFRGNIRTMTPYINTDYFDFEYPNTAEGWRIIDAQYRSSTRYVGTTMRGDRSAFGFNFADGRIKSYPVAGRGAGRGAGRQYVRCVRGPTYGKNDLVDNGDGTITDRATGLMWTKADSGKTMSWQEALEYAEHLEYAGYDDWRLPNVKELQSIVDYSRAPDARLASARGAAIDPIFDLTDKESWFWTGTTHIENGFGYYVCFGRALSARQWNGRPMNAHGAGAVRSDPKTGNPSRWANGLGPQSDEVRIYNYVRCVRGGSARLRTSPPPADSTKYPYNMRVSPSRRSTSDRMDRPGGPNPPGSRGFVRRLDADGDGKVSKREFDGPPHHFDRLDRDGDGLLSEDEAPKGPPPGRRPRILPREPESKGKP